MRVGPLLGLWFWIWFRRGRAMPRRLCAPGTGAVCGTSITGLCYDIDPAGVKYKNEPVTGDDGKPYTVAAYLNGPGAIVKDDGTSNFTGSPPDLTQEQATDPDYLQQAIPKSSETHSGKDVAIYAKGPWSHLFDGTVAQNYIFHVMRHAASSRSM